jgi:hypothetical protein
MTEKRYDFVDLGETWAVSVDGECKYYMHLIDDCKEVVELLNENEQLQKRIQELEIGENEIILKQETTINQLIKENEQLKKELQELQTFKEILEFAEKDMEERVDWQSYCEKEFEGL